MNKFSSVIFRSFFFILFSAFLMVTFTGCETDNVIIHNIEEREANEIVVLLANKNIIAHKVAAASGGAAAGGEATNLWNISVEEKKSTEAMSILNQNGLPRKAATSLLDVFSKKGLVTSEKEELIRFQSGLAAQIASTIRKIDGILDADVQLSIPEADTNVMTTEAVHKKVTAAVYIKHHGILDDPNSHLIIKIKRLVSSSVPDLDVNDVTVIPDKSRLMNISLEDSKEDINYKNKEYVSIFSIIMSKASALRFRMVFFLLLIFIIFLALLVGWVAWKTYPIIKRNGIKGFFKLAPFKEDTENKS